MFTILKNCLLTLSAAIIVYIILVSSHGLAHASQDLEETIDLSLSRISQKEGYSVSPEVKRSIISNIEIFVGNFCYPPESKQGKNACNQTINNELVLDASIVEYLENAYIDRPENIVSIAARLANRIDQNIELTGWPSRTKNIISPVSLPPINKGKKLLIKTALGIQNIGLSGRVIFTTPGIFTLIFEDSNDLQSAINVKAKARMVVVARAGDGQVDDVSNTGDIIPSSNMFCYEKIAGLASKPLGEFNFGRSTFTESQEIKDLNLAPILKQHAIKIDILDETNICGDDCKTGLGISFIEALAIWKSGCARCPKNAISVVKVKNEVWLDGILLDRIIEVRERKASSKILNLSLTRSNERQRTLRAPSINVPLTAVSTFKSLNNRDDLNFICSLPLDIAPWVEETQNLICKLRQKRSNTFTQTLKLLRGDTACGPYDEDIIACGHPDNLIELTIADMDLEYPSMNGVTKVSLNPKLEQYTASARSIILHEVGHWFGVPHESKIPEPNIDDIMVDVLGDGEICVSGQSLRMLNNATDVRWPYRASEPLGLRLRK